MKVNNSVKHWSVIFFADAPKPYQHKNSINVAKNIVSKLHISYPKTEEQCCLHLSLVHCLANHSKMLSLKTSRVFGLQAESANLFLVPKVLYQGSKLLFNLFQRNKLMNLKIYFVGAVSFAYLVLKAQ